MNTLAHGLLSLLSLSPSSGYDLMLRIQLIWPAKHSQIYPLMASLEKDGMVTSQLVQQSDKPDKKVYSLTEQGIDALRAWAREDVEGHPVLRDELMLKLYCLPVVELESSRLMITKRMEYYRSKEVDLEQRLVKLRDKEGGDPKPDSTMFGNYLLLHKGLADIRAGLGWCEWALTQLSVEKS
ncbi:Transcriptional regulator PadR-like family protein [compost metagenome]